MAPSNAFASRGGPSQLQCENTILHSASLAWQSLDDRNDVITDAVIGFGKFSFKLQSQTVETRTWSVH